MYKVDKILQKKKEKRKAIVDSRKDILSRQMERIRRERSNMGAKKKSWMCEVDAGRVWCWKWKKFSIRQEKRKKHVTRKRKRQINWPLKIACE